MAHLVLASSKIPHELMERLKRFTESTGLNQSAAIRRAIEQFLDSDESTGLSQLTDTVGLKRSTELVERVDEVDDRLTQIEARLRALEVREKTSPPIAAPTQPKQKGKKISGDSLTTGQAWHQLQKNGYSKTTASLRRELRTAIDSGKLSPELIALGLRADFSHRRAANPKDNSVRWLQVDPL